MTAFAHQPVIPQIQVTQNCNLDCAYCFQEHRGGIIDFDTVQMILEKTISHYQHHYRDSEGNYPLTVIWHGGEPLLGGIKFFQRIIEIESRFSDVQFENRIQTNGTLMTRELAEFFVDHRFGVGFSIDGPEKIHDLNRRFRKSSRGTFEATMRGIEIYQSYADLDYIPVIAVITRAHLNRVGAFYDFFKGLDAKVQLNIYDIRCLDLNPLAESLSTISRWAPTSSEVGEFLIELFNLWFYDPVPGLDISDLRDEVEMILQPEINKGDPFYKKRCNLGRTVFDSNGRVYSCDQYVNDDNTALGHIHSDSLQDILDRKDVLWQEIRRHIRQSASMMSCFACEWGHRCRGGCITCMKYNAMLLRARANGLADTEWHATNSKTILSDISGETYYCEGLRTFRSYLKHAVEKELNHKVCDTHNCKHNTPVSMVS